MSLIGRRVGSYTSLSREYEMINNTLLRLNENQEPGVHRELSVLKCSTRRDLISAGA